MASDAHAHPFDLAKVIPSEEKERQALGISCAASAWNEEQFLYHEKLARESRENFGPEMMLCFAIHPQLPREHAALAETLFPLLEKFASAKRLDAVGETGFDFFDESYRATIPEQEKIFRHHLALALEYKLPLVLHIRRAMEKVFYYAGDLKKLPSVIFHSYSGTLKEAGDLLKRGVNAYYSFGAAIALNHKKAMEAAALLPAERLLTETDAPYQPLRGRDFSSWGDIHTVIRTMAGLRDQSGSTLQTSAELEMQVDMNFRKAFLEL